MSFLKSRWWMQSAFWAGFSVCIWGAFAIESNLPAALALCVLFVFVYSILFAIFYVGVYESYY